jgi:methylated-DNA-[protein]-cysteine S-methyltransferase
MSGPYSGLDTGSCAGIDSVAAAIQAFLEGDDVAFSLDSVDIDICSPFQRSVLKAEFGIPRGMVSTYGLIAAHIGREGGARAVGNALATNPFPFIIPCHRAVRSDGSLGGYQGGPDMKRRLLEYEGIIFDGAGRAISQRFYQEG